MSLGNYIGACGNLATELTSSLTGEEVAALHAALKGKKLIDWVRWRANNEGLIAEFVAATPKERHAKKKFQTHRLYLTMAGAQHCLEAQVLLRVFENSMLTPGGSYRAMAATAGLAFGDVIAAEVPYWPFRTVATPFEDDPGLIEDAESEWR